MNKYLHYIQNSKTSIFLLSVSTLLLSSCIEIKETLTLKENGGGNYSFVIYYNQHLNKKKNKEALLAVTQDFYEELDELKEELEYEEGISNVETITENMGAFDFSFDFIDNKSLKKALNYTTDIGVVVNEKSINHTGVYNAVLKELNDLSFDDLEDIVDEQYIKDYGNAVYTFTVNSYKPMQLRPSGLPEVFSDDGKTVTYTYFYNKDEYTSEDYNHTLFFQ